MSNTIEKVLTDQKAFLERALDRAKVRADRARANAVEYKTEAREADEIVVNLRAALQQVTRDLDTGRLN